MTKLVHALMVFIICLFTNKLLAVDKLELQYFIKQFSNKDTNEYHWNELAFAIEHGYDEIAVFFVEKNQSFLYQCETLQRKTRNSGSFNETFFRNSIITLIRNDKLDILNQILTLNLNKPITYEYSITSGRIQDLQTALHVAIESKENSLEIIKILIDHGADVNEISYKRDWTQWDANPNNIYQRQATSPLQIATKKEKFDVIEYLINEGANVGAALDTAHLSILRNREDILQLLLENYFNDYHHLYSCFDMAINCNNITAVICLLGFGVQPNSKHIYYALDHGYYEIADLLTDVLLVK